VNPNAALMATLGDCASITSSTFTILNEVTTVASVFALAPFMSSYANIGASSSNAKGLASAFATVNKLVDVAKGSASGPALPPEATIDSSKLNSLANIVVQCMHSAGGQRGDGSPCGSLFSLVAVDDASVPTDTIGLALSIAQNPANGAAALFAFAQTSSPFSPQLRAAPSDWSLAITYRNGGFSAPSSTSVDKEGNIWVANAGNSTVSVLAQSGFPAFGPLSGNGLDSPVAIAIDTTGAAWVVNNGGSSVSIFQSDGEVGTIPPATVGSKPTAIAVDPLGAIWVANSANNTLTQLSLTGTVMKTVASQVNLPSGIAINTK
jgi:streptogramin lyase